MYLLGTLSGDSISESSVMDPVYLHAWISMCMFRSKSEILHLHIQSKKNINIQVFS